MRDYKMYSELTTVIEEFERYEELIDVNFDKYEGGFMPWFECFLSGFSAGGCN